MDSHWLFILNQFYSLITRNHTNDDDDDPNMYTYVQQIFRFHAWAVFNFSIGYAQQKTEWNKKKLWKLWNTENLNSNIRKNETREKNVQLIYPFSWCLCFARLQLQYILLLSFFLQEQFNSIFVHSRCAFNWWIKFVSLLLLLF